MCIRDRTYSTFVQGFMPTLARPEVDVLDGLTTAILVDQQRMGADARSTVGTATDVNAMLRIVFSRLGVPHIGSPNAFSFNVPSVRATGVITVERGSRKTVQKTFSVTGGMCARCEGMGSVTDLDLAELFDDRAPSASREPSQSGQVVKTTARSTKARKSGCIASTSLDRNDFWIFGISPS